MRMLARAVSMTDRTEMRRESHWLPDDVPPRLQRSEGLTEPHLVPRRADGEQRPEIKSALGQQPRQLFSGRPPSDFRPNSAVFPQLLHRFRPNWADLHRIWRSFGRRFWAMLTWASVMLRENSALLRPCWADVDQPWQTSTKSVRCGHMLEMLRQFRRSLRLATSGRSPFWCVVPTGSRRRSAESTESRSQQRQDPRSDRKEKRVPMGRELDVAPRDAAHNPQRRQERHGG